MSVTKKNISTLFSIEKGGPRRPPFSNLVAILSLLSLAGVLSCEGQRGAPPASKANAPPSISAIHIIPEKPTQGSDLTVSVESKDPEGDPITYAYQWIENDEEISGEEKSVLNCGRFKKGDFIRVKATPSDATGKGNPSVSSPIRILNSPPELLELRIEPKVAFASDPLKAISRSEDKDGDFVYLVYRWEKNGVELREEKTNTLGGVFKKGDSISVTVTPDDREAAGAPRTSDAILISNSPPVITSSPPSQVKGNAYLYQVKVNDPDNDPITFALKSGPKGMKIDKASGLVQWEIQKEDKGTYSVEIEASDNAGAKSIQSYTLAVEVK
jgi:hypothetical protein